MLEIHSDYKRVLRLLEFSSIPLHQNLRFRNGKLENITITKL